MRCAPTRPVSVLQVHGVNDPTIRYTGGSVSGGLPAYPSARDTVASWARLNRCATMFTETDMRADYVSEAPGAETRVGRHEGCMGGAAELWTMDATGHIPGLTPNWADAVFDWLQAHAR
jgi:polyhydroxybutyrate depolymerase